jgi:hypothetical protein
VSAAFFVACGQQDQHPNQLTDAEKEEGWELLFDGESLTGWHLYNKEGVKSTWEVSNGELVCNQDADAEHGDLVTDREFDNYELTFEWKIPQGGNSGVFINVVEAADDKAAWFSGPEYQLLEDTHPDFVVPVKRSGCLYGFSPQLSSANNRPLGEWNQSLIRQQDGKVQFYLNGNLTAEQDFTSEAWADSVANSGFKNYPNFGKYTKGKIALQEWSSGISFRNIKIRNL